MTKEEYRAIRQSLGTQKLVAARLGIAYTTVQRREWGKIAITREAEIALRALLKKQLRP
jgi:DNA-binding transcriptional regulator YiaG